MPGVDFEKLRRQITLAEVLAALGFTATTRCGDQVHAPCPVHGSRSAHNRSFSANLHSGRYYCHKCHSHGNALELWAAVHHLPLYDAAVHLCHVLGRDVPWVRRWCPSAEQK